MSEDYRRYRVRIKSVAGSTYYGSNKTDWKERQRKQEESFYAVVNKIVELGGIIDPGKNFYVTTYLNIRATENIAHKIGKLEHVERVE